MSFLRFLYTCVRLMLRGGWAYWCWVLLLLALVAWGADAYLTQFKDGLILSNMRDEVSWGFYVGNFTFLVGVAAAAVLLVIPAYVYEWKPIKEVAILGELLAISAIVMCLLFVIVDMGRPDRFWHVIPFLGVLNFPRSLLAWDCLVLNAYLGLNVFIVVYLLYCTYVGKHYNKALAGPLILFSVPLAISIHTVTAFLYNGMPSRPFWNASILAPRFLCSAFCSGPAIMIIVFQILQRTTRLKIQNEAIWKVAELMAYAMFLNLFLLGAEVFKEYYSATQHLVHFQYLFSGFHGANSLVVYSWAAIACSVISFVLFLVPATRRNFVTLNLGCLLIYTGVYIEKGIGLVVPGFTPSILGEIYEYVPTLNEVRIGGAVFSIGFLVFTFLCKIAVPMMTGEFRTAGLAEPGSESAGDAHAGTPVVVT
ncbi:MAG: polysulfide reductase NrfD [Planctomycetes bacterium]|nr:polysulfide reductase NrfD [Planctomycetota bacterium]